VSYLTKTRDRPPGFRPHHMIHITWSVDHAIPTPVMSRCRQLRHQSRN